MTIDDLAARWGVDAKRAWKRVKNGGVKAVNLGTAKNPAYRFRLAAIEAWEVGIERQIEDEPGQQDAPQGLGSYLGGHSQVPQPNPGGLGPYVGRRKKKQD